jgi:hypothetical protein
MTISWACEVVNFAQAYAGAKGMRERVYEFSMQLSVMYVRK